MLIMWILIVLLNLVAGATTEQLEKLFSNGAPGSSAIRLELCLEQEVLGFGFWAGTGSDGQGQVNRLAGCDWMGQGQGGSDPENLRKSAMGPALKEKDVKYYQQVPVPVRHKVRKLNGMFVKQLMIKKVPCLTKVIPSQRFVVFKIQC